MTQEKPEIIPFLRYKDAPAAIDFLTSAFGFEKTFVAPGENGAIAHAQLRLGQSFVMLATGGDHRDSPPTDISDVTQGIYVVVDDTDAHCARAKKAGAVIVREPEDTDYGSREYAALDTGGHYWGFGTYRPE